MFKKLLIWLGGISADVDREVIRIIEVEKPRSIEELKREGSETVTSLAAHPGFQYLLAKLRTQRAWLQSKLTTESHTVLSDVHRLQAGVYWAGWLEAELRREVEKHVPQAQSALDAELELFKKISANLIEVGKSSGA